MTTLRRVRVTTVALGEKIIIYIMSVFLYFCRSYLYENRILFAPYCVVICGLTGSTVFFHIIS